MLRGAFVLAFAWFLWHAPPGVDWLDAGELAGAAFGLGVSHPPGQPLHALLGRLIACVPLGEVAFRIAALSALAGAALVTGTYALARALLGERGQIPAAAAALLVALSPLTLGQAARIEVYAPLAALVTWGTVLALRWQRSARAGDALGAAFLFALAVGLQPLVAAACALPFALAIAVRVARRLIAPALGLGALALAIYAYLPLRWGAAHEALVLWSDKRGMWPFVTGVAYGHNFDLAGTPGRLPGHLMLFGEGVGLAVLVLGGAGLLFAALTRLRGALPLATAVLLLTAATASQRVFHPANPDIHGYLLPGLPLLAAGLAAFLAAGERALAALIFPRQVKLGPSAVAPGLLFAAALAAAGPTVHAGALGPRDRDDARRYAAETAFRLPPGPAIFLASSDHALFPALYERAVAGERPDVVVAGTLLLASSFHLRSLRLALPEVRIAVDPDRFVADNLAAGWAVGGEQPRPRRPATPLGWGFLYRDGVPAPAPLPRFSGELGERIARHVARTRAAGGSLAAELPMLTPVFIAEPWQLELAWREVLFDARLPRPPVRPDAPAEVRLLDAWQRVLDGQIEALDGFEPAAATTAAQLLLRRGRADDALALLARTRAAHPDAEGPPLLEAAVRGNRGELPLAEALLAGLVARRPELARGHAQLGLVLAKQGRLDEARAAWERSLALDPEQPDVRAWLARVTSSSGSPPAARP